MRAYDTIVECLDGSQLGLEYQPDKVGAPEYDPRAMLKLPVYGYAYGVRRRYRETLKNVIRECARLSRIAFPAFTYPYRVFYADTDAGGVMYYAQYLRVFEQARALYIEEFGLRCPNWRGRTCSSSAAGRKSTTSSRLCWVTPYM